MAGINKVILVGCLGKDPQIINTTNGNKLANFTVATSDVWKDKNTGERKERTEWHSISVTSPSLANLTEKYLRKGAKVYVEGKLLTREWTDQNGNKRFKTEVVCGAYDSSIQMLDAKKENTPSTEKQEAQEIGWQEEPTQEQEFLDDDIPF